MKYLLIIINIIINATINTNINAFKINFFDPVIGKWNLLYSDNSILNLEKDNCEISISQFEDKIDKLSVKITKLENIGFIRFSKTINSNAYYSSKEVFEEDTINNDLIDNGDYCSLIILTAEKSISSIGIFNFPYFASNYKSGMRPKYLVSWRIDNALNRLYIYLDGKTYIFERSHYDKKKNNEDSSITINAFFITNIISFILGKLIEKAVHL